MAANLGIGRVDDGSSVRAGLCVRVSERTLRQLLPLFSSRLIRNRAMLPPTTALWSTRSAAVRRVSKDEKP